VVNPANFEKAVQAAVKGPESKEINEEEPWLNQ
jgi:hypothetical protein